MHDPGLAWASIRSSRLVEGARLFEPGCWLRMVAGFVLVWALALGAGSIGCVQDEAPSPEASRLTVHNAHPVDEFDCRAPTCRIVQTQSVLGRDEPVALIEDPVFTAPLASIVQLSVERRPSVHVRSTGARGEPVWVPLVFVDEASQRAIWPAFNDSSARPGRVIAVVAIDGRAIVSVTRGTLPSPIELGEYASLEAAQNVVTPLRLPVAQSGSALGRGTPALPDSADSADAMGEHTNAKAGVFDALDDATLRKLEAFEARLDAEEEDPEVVARELSDFLRAGSGGP